MKRERPKRCQEDEDKIAYVTGKIHAGLSDVPEDADIESSVGIGVLTTKDGGTEIMIVSSAHDEPMLMQFHVAMTLASSIIEAISMAMTGGVRPATKDVFVELYSPKEGTHH